MKGINEGATIMLMLVVTFGISGGLYVFIHGIYAEKNVTFEMIDAYCANSTASFVVRNGGASNITSLKCMKNDSGCSGDCAVDYLPSGGAGYVKISGCSQGIHRFTISDATNSLQLVTYCK